MRKALVTAGLLCLLPACDSKAPSSPPSPREMEARALAGAMKTIDQEDENIDKDLKAGKPAEEARRRLVVIRNTAEQASKLDYRDSEAENRDLAFEFRKFIDAAAKLESAAWQGDEGQRAYRR